MSVSVCSWALQTNLATDRQPDLRAHVYALARGHYSHAGKQGVACSASEPVLETADIGRAMAGKKTARPLYIYGGGTSCCVSSESASNCRTAAARRRCWLPKAPRLTLIVAVEQLLQVLFPL